MTGPKGVWLIQVALYLSECRFLPESDRRAYAPMIQDDDKCEDDEEELQHDSTLPNEEDTAFKDQPSIRRVGIVQSPFLNCYFGPHLVRLTLDTGATTNMIRTSFAKLAKL